MSRLLRFSYPHAIQHLTLRCKNREFLFDEAGSKVGDQPVRRTAEIAGRGVAGSLWRGWPFGTLPAPLLNPSAHPPMPRKAPACLGQASLVIPGALSSSGGTSKLGDRNSASVAREPREHAMDRLDARFRASGRHKGRKVG